MAFKRLFFSFFIPDSLQCSLFSFIFAPFKFRLRSLVV